MGFFKTCITNQTYDSPSIIEKLLKFFLPGRVSPIFFYFQSLTWLFVMVFYQVDDRRVTKAFFMKVHRMAVL